MDIDDEGFPDGGPLFLDDGSPSPHLRSALPVRIRKGYRDGLRVWEIMSRLENDGEVDWRKIGEAETRWHAEHIAGCVNACTTLHPSLLAALTNGLHAFSLALAAHVSVFAAAPSFVLDDEDL